MKKNILTIIIMALTVVNVIMTAVMFFVMLPTFSKTNALITQVATVLNLELESTEEDGENHDIKNIEEVAFAFENKETINLPVGTDGKTRYAMLSGFTVNIDKESKDYKEVSEMLTAQQSSVKDIVISVIASHPADELTQELIKKEALEKIQEYFDSKCIVSISLDGFMFS